MRGHLRVIFTLSSNADKVIKHKLLTPSICLWVILQVSEPERSDMSFKESVFTSVSAQHLNFYVLCLVISLTKNRGTTWFKVVTHSRLMKASTIVQVGTHIWTTKYTLLRISWYAHLKSTSYLVQNITCWCINLEKLIHTVTQQFTYKLHTLRVSRGVRYTVYKACCDAFSCSSLNLMGV